MSPISMHAEAERLRQQFLDLKMDGPQRASSEEVLQRLISFDRFDERLEALRKRFRQIRRPTKTVVLVVAGALFLLGVLIASEESPLGRGDLVLGNIVVGVALAVGALGFYSPKLVDWYVRTRLSSHDVPDDLRSFVIPFVRVLREDMEPGGELMVWTNFYRICRRENLQSQQDLLPADRIISGTESLFRARVFAAEAQLRGGGKLAVEMTLQRRLREGWKQKRWSSKRERFAKLRDQLLLEVRLSLPREMSETECPPGYAKCAANRGEKRNTILLRRKVDRAVTADDHFVATAESMADRRDYTLSPQILTTLLTLVGDAFRRFAADAT